MEAFLIILSPASEVGSPGSDKTQGQGSFSPLTSGLNLTQS